MTDDDQIPELRGRMVSGLTRFNWTYKFSRSLGQNLNCIEHETGVKTTGTNALNTRKYKTSLKKQYYSNRREKREEKSSRHRVRFKRILDLERRGRKTTAANELEEIGEIQNDHGDFYSIGE